MASLFLASVFLGCGGAEEAEEAATPPAEAGAPTVPDTPSDVAAPPDDAEVTESGLASKVLTPGTGTGKPTALSKVTVHYTGWTASDGERFDSSFERGEPATFPLNAVIAGWTEGLQLMVVGEKRRFWIPEALAYGGTPGKPAGMLTFDIELLGIRNPPAPPTQLEPPADALKTEGGVPYVVVEPGTGAERATLDDTVHFHFSAWTDQGQLVQTSFNAPDTPRSRVSALIPTWRELAPQMVVGQKVRAWPPRGFDQISGGPPGRTIFDFEIEAIDKPLPAPADVAAPPADATTTASGLSYKILERGGGDPVGADDAVRMNFTIWTSADGKMFDSTAQHGSAAVVQVRTLSAPGWKEALPLLSEGDEARLWIPEALSFPPGTTRGPTGALTIDVEVVDIIEPPKPLPAPE
ncbi:MAG: FKBP-type peptidyl-prolyl cis-trans isomerase [Myxococcota bacterium]